MKLKDLKISKLNVRNESEDQNVDTLVESIKKFNLLNKIIIQEKSGLFEVIAGQRRYKALLKVHGEDYELSTDEYVVRNDLSDWEALILSIDENQQRVELSPLELNRAALKLNNLKEDLKEKEIADILNITPFRLKRILHLSDDLSKMPPSVKEELQKPSGEAKLNDAHWEKIRSSEIIENPDAVKDVVDYILDKECPPRELPMIIKAINKTYEESEKSNSHDTTKVDTNEEDFLTPIEYKHKGQIILEEHGDEKILKVVGHGEDEEVPIDHYLNFLRNTEKFKCYITFKLKIRPIQD